MEAEGGAEASGGGGDDPAEVAGGVNALLLLGEVKAPVAVEVAVGAQGTEFEHGLGAIEAPTGTGDAQPVLNKVTAGGLDDAGG